MTRPPAAEPEISGLFCAAEHYITGALCNRLAALCTGIHTADGEDPWIDREDTNR